MKKQKNSPRTKKRLDGKKILVSLTAQMTTDIQMYCREKGIESENELFRQAIVHFIDREYDDNTLKLSGLKDIRESLLKIQDMISVLFSYINLMHLNTLAYHYEIPEEHKETAKMSAKNRLDKFFNSFREHLRDDPAFFERILHKYVTGTLDE